MGKTRPILETLGMPRHGTWRHSPGILHRSRPPKSAGKRETRPPPGLGYGSAYTEGSDSSVS